MTHRVFRVAKDSGLKEVAGILDNYLGRPGSLEVFRLAEATLAKHPSLNWPSLAASELHRRAGVVTLLRVFSDEVIVAISLGAIDMPVLLNQALRRNAR